MKRDATGVGRRLAWAVLAAALLTPPPAVAVEWEQYPPTELSGTQTPALKQLIEDAKSEGGTLNILNDPLANSHFITAVSQGMTKAFGFPIRVHIVPGMTTSPLAIKLADEYRAGRPASTDVFLGDDVNAMVQIRANAVFNVDWKALAPSVPSVVIGPDNAFLRLYSRVIGNLSYNTNLVEPAEVPQQLSDVLKPKWKRRLATTPYIGGFREAAGFFGREKQMVDFLAAFRASGNLRGFIRDGEAQRIASGEFAMLVVSATQNESVRLRSQGAPINFTVLKDMPNISFWVLNIPKNAVHPNLAKLFVLFMTTREGQSIYHDNQFGDLHYLKGSKTAIEFERSFANIKPEIVTNEVLTTNWDSFNNVRAILTKVIRGK
jgi:ABC-type Fe3+ transport system substrate-binding protein